MRKIPTVFERSTVDRKHIIPGAVTPGCKWVLRGEGVASRKWDGTCVRIQHDWHDGPCIAIYTRHEVKPGKATPEHFEAIQHDEVTGKTVGWVPYATSGFSKFIDEALGNPDPILWPEGTYELVGPKINGNPDRIPTHRLIQHGHPTFALDEIRSGIDLIDAVRYVGDHGWEGLVWRHPDGRMAKLKARDLPSAEASQ